MTNAPIHTVLSNIWFAVLPGLGCLSSGLFYEAIHFFVLSVFSGLYHHCFNYLGDLNKCPWDPWFLQFADFYYSYKAPCIIIIYLLDVKPRKYKDALHSICDVAILTMTYLNKFSITGPATVYACILIMAIFHTIREVTIYVAKNRKFKIVFYHLKIDFSEAQTSFQPWHLVFILAGSIFFTVGFICQSLSYHDYDVLHSIWHFCMAFSAWLFLFPNRENSYILLAFLWVKFIVWDSMFYGLLEKIRNRHVKSPDDLVPKFLREIEDSQQQHVIVTNNSV